MHPLPPSELHLWHLNSGENRWSDNLPLFVRLLNTDELHRMRSFEFDYLRHAFTITRALCRLVLSRYIPEVNPKEWQFGRNAFGRPHAILPSNSPDIDFNISHSQGIIVMAVAASRHSVGVDVEEVASAPIQPAIASRYFSAAEQADLKALPDAKRIDRFFELWTVKEAYIKARGMGLSMPLDTFSVSIRRDDNADRPLWARLTSTPPDDDPERWSLILCDFPPRHKLALCARIGSPQEALTLRCFDFELQV